jgi:fructose-1,6-bisphosphatase/inositol monophosphatase family enzyme
MPLVKPAPAAVSAPELLAAAHALADAAGARILPYFRKALTVENKHASGGFDPVTIADKAAERVMRQAIRKRFPDHAITGEEYAAHDSASRYRWVLDPIDGTRGFMCGLPTWGTLIGLASAYPRHDGSAVYARPLLGSARQSTDAWWGWQGARAQDKELRGA